MPRGKKNAEQDNSSNVPSEPKKKGKKAQEELPEGASKKDQLEALAARINKDYKGQAIIRQGCEIRNVFLLRRPTGIPRLDLSLGGGFPAGGLTQIVGKDSSGKSYLSNRVIANVQDIYGEDAAIGINMTEMRYDKRFAKWKSGVAIAFNDDEIAEMELARAQYGMSPFTPDEISWLKHQTGYISETVGATAEQILEVACQQVESNLFQVVLIDSFGALLTKAEAEADDGLEQKHRGGAAGVVTQFMHRLHAALNMPDKNGNPNTTTVIGINQYRDNVNAGLYGNPMKLAGGWALRHGKLVDLHLEAGAREWIGPDGKKVVAGKNINWEIIKGKAGCHDGPKGSYTFYFGEYGYTFGPDVYMDLLYLAREWGVVESRGAWHYYKGAALGQGDENAKQQLMAQPDLYKQVLHETYSKAGLVYLTKEVAPAA